MAQDDMAQDDMAQDDMARRARDGQKDKIWRE
jgi:hypothetical protein